MSEAHISTAPKPGLLGVCGAIGEDFGFNPEYLRAAMVLAMLWNAYLVAGAYLAIGAVVAISRWLVPATRKAKPAAVPEPVAESPAATLSYEYARAA